MIRLAKKKADEKPGVNTSSETLPAQTIDGGLKETAPDKAEFKLLGIDGLSTKAGATTATAVHKKKTPGELRVIKGLISFIYIF